MRQLTEEHQLDKTSFRLFDDGILWLTFSEDVEVDLENTLAQHELVTRMTKGKSVALLIDTRKRYVSATKESREKSALLAAESNRIADAILVDSMATTLIGNFYIRFNKPPIPTRLFTAEEKALKWLLAEIGKAKKKPDHKDPARTEKQLL